MKRCLICAGLVVAMLCGDWSAVARAQTVVPPTNPNNLTPQQRQKIRQMMRLRRHHRHRHKIPATAVTPVTPTTSMIATPFLQNPMVMTQFPVRHRGHHHRHQLLMAQMMMRQMMMNQAIQNQDGVNRLPPAAVPQTPAPTNPGKSLAARKKKLMLAQFQQASF